MVDGVFRWGGCDKRLDGVKKFFMAAPVSDRSVPVLPHGRDSAGISRELSSQDGDAVTHMGGCPYKATPL
jgi:hypothetical protein